MPVTIVVKTDSESERALTFDGERIVIGRGPGSDVRLPDPSVSHRHAVVQVSGSSWVLVDEGSSNGTFVGGVKLARRAPRSIKSGDLVRVGRVWLEVRIDQATPTRDLAGATRDLAMQLVAEAMEKIGDDLVTKLRVVEGPDRDMVLRLPDEGRIYVLGRGEHCDMPLADADASREHARVVRRGPTVLVRDAGSRNGTKLGEQVVPADRDLQWKNPLVLRIGKTVIALEEPVQVALDELESAADEILPESASIPEPPKSKKEVAPPEEPKPPSQRQPAAAPIAQVGEVVTKNTASSRSRFSMTDVVVGFVALVVIGLSVAGLVWLLRG